MTVQAYLSEPGGNLLSCAAIRTEALFAVAARLADGGAPAANRDPRLYGVRALGDGTDVLCLAWDYLIHLEALDPEDTHRG